MALDTHLLDALVAELTADRAALVEEVGGFIDIAHHTGLDARDLTALGAIGASDVQRVELEDNVLGLAKALIEAIAALLAHGYPGRPQVPTPQSTVAAVDHEIAQLQRVRDRLSPAPEAKTVILTAEELDGRPIPIS